jgi:anion-transporting  ArsA/GET3 family ATPase
MKNLLVAIFVLCSNLCAFADDMPINQIISIAAKQRALSQRVMKSWVCKNEGIEVSNSTKEIALSENTFEQTLELILEKVPTAPVKDNFKKVEANWQAFKNLIEDPKNQNYQTTLTACNLVLSSSEFALKELINYAKTQEVKTTSGYNYAAVLSSFEICGKQRSLTQRLVLFYALHVSGKSTGLPANKSAIGILEEINDNFKRLIVAEINTGDINDELSLLTAEWKKTYEQMKLYNYEIIEKKKMPVISLYENMNNLYNKFDKIVTMYATLLKN